MMSDQALRAYERYILTDRNIEEALKFLPNENQDHLFLKFMHIQHEQGLAPFKSDKKLKAKLTYYFDRYSNDERSSMLEIRHNLMAYDSAKSESERLEALKELRKRCHWENFDTYSKPTNLKKVQAEGLEEEDKRDTGDDENEEDLELKKFSSHFNYDEMFNKRTIIDDRIEQNCAKSIHPVSSFHFRVIICRDTSQRLITRRCHMTNRTIDTYSSATSLLEVSFHRSIL